MKLRKHMAKTIERSLVVSFDRVITIPVTVPGMGEASIYLGVTGICAFNGDGLSDDNLRLVAKCLNVTPEVQS